MNDIGLVIGVTPTGFVCCFVSICDIKYTLALLRVNKLLQLQSG